MDSERMAELGEFRANWAEFNVHRDGPLPVEPGDPMLEWHVSGFEDEAEAKGFTKAELAALEPTNPEYIARVMERRNREYEQRHRHREANE